MSFSFPSMTARLRCAAVPLGLLVACRAADLDPNVERAAALRLADVRPERYLPDDIDARPDSGRLRLPGRVFDTDEEGQKDTLPALPSGMTVQMIRDGDRLFHGRGGCVDCHGLEGEGLAGRGKTLTAGLGYVPAGDWNALDSLVAVGVAEALTRSAVAMPPRGQWSDLTADEVRRVAAYVWAVSQVRGEPWAGGHALHGRHDWRASARTSIP